MQKEWSSFQITLILYFSVLILPFGFYFVYTSFKTIQTDTRIVRQSTWTAGAIQHLSAKQTKKQIQHIDKALLAISSWVTKNSDSKFYIGEQSLSKDYSEVNTCWSSYKMTLATHSHTAIQQHGLQCYETTEKLALIIEKIVYLKQKKLINIFYASLTIAMLLILLIIYMVRVYIHNQMKKHAIHDHESRLFNKKYFMSELKITCSRSVRHNYPLSMLCVSIDNFEKENTIYTNRTKINTLKILGILIHSLVRDGDIPCRYDENHLFILLPFTEKENALFLEERIRTALEKDNWMRTKNIICKFQTTEFDKNESEKAFITRTLNE
jgi:diguanylate cyclase (GGDEF)-like protein